MIKYIIIVERKKEKNLKVDFCIVPLLRMKRI